MTGFSLAGEHASLANRLRQVVEHRRTPLVANLLVVVLLAHSLAQWTWRAVTPKAVPAPPATTAATSRDDAAAMRSLLAANLFGAVAPGQGGVSPETLPLTSLNLVLTGVIVRGKDSFALIKIDGGDEEPVVVGQEIKAGARLHAVYPERAVISRSGSYESLVLKDHAGSLAPGSIVSKPSAAGPVDLSRAIRRQGDQFTVDRDSMLQQMQRPEFLSQAMVVPNANGGFLVREVQPGGMYDKLGVRVGDVIKSVNGQAINTMDDVMKIYQQLGGLQNASGLSVEIVRGGRSQHFNYQLQ